MDVTLVEFGGGHSARVVRPRQFADLAVAITGLGFYVPQPVLVVVGGAGGLDEGGKERLSVLFRQALVPVAVAGQAVVVDGGTDSGVMQLIGRARAAANPAAGTPGFPLVGVAAERTVMLPGDNTELGDRALLEAHHSHFVLVPGSSWGDESPWIARVASKIAGNAPSTTILINGGEIAFRDVAHSLEAGRSVLAVAGTGRAADKIAAAVNGDRTDEQAARLADSRLVSAVSWTEDPAVVRAALEKLISPGTLDSAV